MSGQAEYDSFIEYADLGSWSFFSDDVELDRETTEQGEKEFGPFSCYAFASAANAKCDRFFSVANMLGTGGIDFFMQSLVGQEKVLVVSSTQDFGCDCLTPGDV